MLVLEGNDGSKSHAIATVQNLIFDSNCDCAMDLSKENLDWCVSSDHVDCQFVGVHWGLILFHSCPPINLGSDISPKVSTIQSSLSCLFGLFGCSELARECGSLNIAIATISSRQ